MGTMPVNRLLISMSLPMIISMLVQALYNIIDSVFVAQISEAALACLLYTSEWEKSAEEAKRIAAEDMGVEFIDVDVDAFKQKVLPLHDTMLQENEKIRDFYDHIQEVNQKVKGGE